MTGVGAVVGGQVEGGEGEVGAQVDCEGLGGSRVWVLEADGSFGLGG